MADIKISNLPPYPGGAAPAASDLLAIVDTSSTPFITRQVPFSDFASATTTVSFPYAKFVGSATGGANQTFTDAQILLLSNIGQLSLFADGVLLSSGDNFTVSGAQITVLDYLPPNCVVEAIFKLLPGMVAENDLALQNGTDVFVDQGGNNVII